MGYGDMFSVAGKGLRDIYRLRQDSARQRASDIRADAAGRREEEMHPIKMRQAQQGIQTGQLQQQQAQQQLDEGQMKTQQDEIARERFEKMRKVKLLQADKDKEFKVSRYGEEALRVLQTATKAEDLDQYDDYVLQYESDKLEREKMSTTERTADKRIAASADKPDRASASLEKVRQKRFEEFVSVSENNKLSIDLIDEADAALDKIPVGIVGKGITAYKEKFDPNDPVLAAWQSVKQVLTDAQLMNTAKTKGAISDREMALFSEAAANDKIPSPQKIRTVFSKLRRLLVAEQRSKAVTYQKLYNEDPYELSGYAPLGVEKPKTESGPGSFSPSPSPGTRQPKQYPPEVVAQARQAISDPSAPPEVKRKAQKVLDSIGGK